MIRRDFLKTIPCFFFPFEFGKLIEQLEKPKEPVLPYIHPTYGKYVKHWAENGQYCEKLSNTPYVRYVDFPVEARLTIQFETFTLCWVSYNVSNFLINKLNKMSVSAVLKDFEDICSSQCNCHGSLKFEENGRLAWELQGLNKKSEPRTVEFKLSSITVHNVRN